MKQKRIVYYIVQATTEENQNGLYHFSKPFNNPAKAKEEARKITNDFVHLEKHHEYFRGWEYKPEYAWEIDHDFEIEDEEF